MDEKTKKLLEDILLPRGEKIKFYPRAAKKRIFELLSKEDTFCEREISFIKKRYYNGLTYKEIGEQENLSPSRVRTIVVRTLYKLREYPRRSYIMFGNYRKEVNRLEKIRLRIFSIQKELDKTNDLIDEALLMIQEDLI